MALRINQFDGTVITDADYPLSQIKNAPNGTRINAKSNGDIQQFFQKMMSLAKILPNGAPDNVTNGYQLIQALQRLTNSSWLSGSISNLSGLTLGFQDNEIIAISNTSATTNIITVNEGAGLGGGILGNSNIIYGSCNAGDKLSFVPAGAEAIKYLTGTKSLTLKNAGTYVIKVQYVAVHIITVEIYNNSAVSSDFVTLPFNATAWSATTSLPQYKLDGTRVYLRGALLSTSTPGITLANMPVGFRPLQITKVPSYIYDASNVPYPVNVQITTGGVVTVEGNPSISGANFTMWLDAIQYPID